MPAWEKRNIPDQTERRHQLQSRRRPGLAFRQRPRRPPRQGAGRTMTPGNDRRTIATFAIIAFLILGMAVVNFTNLATARASQRAREVALRKVLGATRKQLIVQFVARIDADLGGRDAARAGAGRAAGEAVRGLPRCRPSLRLFRHGRNAAAGDRADPARRHRRAASIRPSSCRASSRRRCSRPTGRPRKRPARAGCAQRWWSCQFAVSIGLIICTAVIYGQTVYRADRRSRLQARPHPPGREHEPRTSCSQGRDDRRSDEAHPGRQSRSALTDIGVSTPTTTTTPG